MRECNACHLEKELTQFSKGGPTNDGFCPYCKACARTVQKPYRDKYKAQKNRERIRDLKGKGQLMLWDLEAS